MTAPVTAGVKRTTDKSAADDNVPMFERDERHVRLHLLILVYKILDTWKKACIGPKTENNTV